MVKVSLIDLLLSFNYIVLFHYIVFMRASKKKEVYLVGMESNEGKSKKNKREKEPTRWEKQKQKRKKNTPRGRDGRFLGSNKAIDWFILCFG